MARTDIEAAVESCRLLLGSVRSIEDPRDYPLSCAVVVCYARPFTNNRPYGPLPDCWPGFALPEHQEVHDEVLAARHEIVAHSDARARPVEISVPGGRLGQTGLGVSVATYYLSFEHYRVLLDAACDLGRRLSEEVERRLEKLFGGMELPNRAFPLRIDDGL